MLEYVSRMKRLHFSKVSLAQPGPNEWGKPATSNIDRLSEPASNGINRLSELTFVTLRHDVLIDSARLPTGSLGRIVRVYHSGMTYEVEFERPFHCMLTLERRMVNEVLVRTSSTARS